MTERQPVGMDAKKTIIRKQNVFSELSDEETNILASLLAEKHFASGDTIVTEGDHVDSVFFIVKGKADVRHVSIQNGEIQIQSITTLEEGAAIGLNETGFFSLSGVRTATVSAITPMITLRLSVAAFHGFALSNSRVSQIMRQRASHILGISSNMDENS